MELIWKPLLGPYWISSFLNIQKSPTLDELDVLFHGIRLYLESNEDRTNKTPLEVWVTWGNTRKDAAHEVGRGTPRGWTRHVKDAHDLFSGTRETRTVDSKHESLQQSYGEHVV